MANRDYPLAPTYMKSKGEEPKKKKRELTPEEQGVITRKQKNQAVVNELKSKGANTSTLAPYLKKVQMSTDSANVVMKNAWGSLKKKK
jgi:hypothetical protein